MRMLCRVNLELEASAFSRPTPGGGRTSPGDGRRVALLLLDIHLGDRDGVDIARALKETRPGIPVAFLTGSGLYSRDAADVVGDATIRKPFTLEELISTVTRVGSVGAVGDVAVPLARPSSGAKTRPRQRSVRITAMAPKPIATLTTIVTSCIPTLKARMVLRAAAPRGRRGARLAACRARQA